MSFPQDVELQQWLKGLEECRSQSLRILAFGQITLSWFLIIPYLVMTPLLGWTVLVLFLGAVGSLSLLRASYRRAAFINVISQFLAAASAVRAFDSGFTEWTYAVPVATTTMLLGSRWAGGVAAGATVALLMHAGVPLPWMSGYALGGIALVWIIAFVAWLGLRPLEQTLAWAISSHKDARARADEAERHRGELGRVVKSLHESHERLDRLTSELERARAAAEHARSLKARFAAYISHELRTPLNLIIGFSEMMVLAPHTYEGEVLPAAYRGDVNAIYQSARHLSTLINDVLDLSQIDAQRMALDRDDVALADIISEAVDTVGAAYAEKGLWLNVEIESDVPPLYLDRTRIRQVLINLLGNALRYTDHGGVTVRTRRIGSDILTAVIDTGQGISSEDLPNLFVDYRRAAGADPEHDEGTGLGLAIAQRFIGLHGGWMRAESEPGQGTTISFGLPLGHALLSPLADPYSVDSPGRGRDQRGALPVVAVLGGDAWLIRAAQRYLDGYRVRVINGGSNGGDGDERVLRNWRREGIVALLTAAPTDAAGWAGLESATTRGDGLPVIGCSLRGSREAVYQLGISAYLDKPITHERLNAVLANWRSGRGSRTILVVDDDQSMVRLLTRMIRATSRRYKVIKAYDGAMALALLRDTVPDLVLLDLLMPGVDGYTVLQRMRADDRLKDVPVVIITARGLEDDAVASGMFGLARAGGLSAGEFMRCLQATLDNLNAPTAGAAPPAHPRDPLE